MNFASQYEALFYQALRIRLVEQRIIELYPSDKIQSPVHLSIGQEAVAVGVCEPLNHEDLLYGTYRSHAFYLAKGGDLKQMFAELYGKVDGCGRGKAGSMHLAAPEVGFMGSSAVVASTIAHAVGSALAADRLNKDHITVAVFGDGATEEGAYHESLNFASLHKLPVFFVCENNGFAVHSRVNARQAYKIREHAASYGLPVAYCEKAADPLKVQKIMSELVAEVRRNRSPYFVEIETYRYREHVGPGEDYEAGYRSRRELTDWQAADPLEADQDTVERFRPIISREIEEAVAFAEASPWPDEKELLAHVI